MYSCLHELVEISKLSYKLLLILAGVGNEALQNLHNRQLFSASVLHAKDATVHFSYNMTGYIWHMTLQDPRQFPFYSSSIFFLRNHSSISILRPLEPLLSKLGSANVINCSRNTSSMEDSCGQDQVIRIRPSSASSFSVWIPWAGRHRSSLLGTFW